MNSERNNSSDHTIKIIKKKKVYKNNWNMKMI